jgi:hypothetical protein
MNPSEPTMATPAKLIFTINEISSREGFVVTCRRRLLESRNSLRFNVKILLNYVKAVAIGVDGDENSGILTPLFESDTDNFNLHFVQRLQEFCTVWASDAFPVDDCCTAYSHCPTEGHAHDFLVIFIKKIL